MYLYTIKQQQRKTYNSGPLVRANFFAMFPILVTRSIMEIAGNKLSVVFTARFADGTEKMLRDVRKNIGATRPSEIGIGNEVVLMKDQSPLYGLNWQSNPVFGSFKKDYPVYG